MSVKQKNAFCCVLRHIWQLNFNNRWAELNKYWYCYSTVEYIFCIKY